MTGKIRAIIKRPDEKYGHVTNISPTLKNLQRTVGGYIETLTLTLDGQKVVVICNESGRVIGLPYNCTISAINIVGDIICVGADGEEFADCPISFSTWKDIVDGTI